jgi:hypothetical protein
MIKALLVNADKARPGDDIEARRRGGTGAGTGRVDRPACQRHGLLRSWRRLGRPAMAQVSRKSQSLYDVDFNAWLEEQAAHARAGRPAMLDLAHLVEELDGLNKSQRHEIENRLRVLLAHLLKHQFQPEGRTRSWLTTIAEQRDQIDVILRDSPSLRAYPATVLADAYGRAKRFAALETGQDENRFPARCPYAIGRILEAGWLP